MERYHLSDVAVNMLPATFYLLYLPGAMFAVWILHTKGLAFGIKLAAIGNAVGALVRIGGLDTRTGYWWLLFGNCIAALIQPLLLASPTKITAVCCPVLSAVLPAGILLVPDFSASSSGLGMVSSERIHPVNLYRCRFQPVGHCYGFCAVRHCSHICSRFGPLPDRYLSGCVCLLDLDLDFLSRGSPQPTKLSSVTVYILRQCHHLA